MKNVEINNRIIAKYMRGKESPPNWTWKYHESWDALMPVIEKIICEEKSMFYFTGPNYIPGIDKYSFSISHDGKNPIKEKGISMFDIAYEGAVNYIKNK